MAQPRDYTRQFNFNDFQATSPADPLPGVRVDAELKRRKTNFRRFKHQHCQDPT